MKWEERHLDDLGLVARGRSRHRPRDAAYLYDGPYPFVQTGDVKHADLYLTSYSQTYSEAGLEQSKLWLQGTLCITIAANIAETAILGFDACFPDSVVGFVGGCFLEGFQRSVVAGSALCRHLSAPECHPADCELL